MLRHPRSGPPRRPAVRLVAIAVAATFAGAAVILAHHALVVPGSGAPGSVPFSLSAGAAPAPNGEIEWP